MIYEINIDMDSIIQTILLTTIILEDSTIIILATVLILGFH